MHGLILSVLPKTFSIFLPNPLSSPHVLIVLSTCCFRVRSVTDNSQLLQSSAKSQKQHSTLLQTWAFWRLCLTSGSNCVHLLYPWQKLSLSHCPLQIPLLLLLARFKFILETLIVKFSQQLCHIHKFGGRYFLPVVHVRSSIWSQGIKVKSTCWQEDRRPPVSFLFVLSYAFLKFERWDKPANLLRSRYI